MLELLRKAARTWVAKSLLLLLVLSFGVWGVSTSLVGTSGDTVVAVGEQQVSVNEFRLAYQRQLASISRQFGTQLTVEQARAFGLEQQVFAQLAAGAALDQLSQDLNLGLSQDRLAGLIADDPAFKAVNGQFDRQLFSSRLRNAGLRENDYIEERSKVAVRSQIVDAVSGGFTPPATLVNALKQYRDETRSIDYLLLTNANIDPVKAPADDVLKTWFDGAKARYRAPEYRKFTYVKLEAQDIANPASITDDEIRADYDKRKDNYRTPETRTIEQLNFADKELADAAATALSSGTTFDQLVTDQGKTATDVLLGDFTKATVPDPAIADAAFAVGKDGGTSPVVQGTFGPVILRITNIRAETSKTLDEVKDQIRKDLALANASQEILNVHDRYEDIRGSGASIEEAAKELNLKTATVAAVDASGRDPQGTEIKDLPAAASLLADVFRSDVNGDTTPVSIGRDGYVWFEVDEITPERDRTLDEVREKATADWTAEQQKAALAAKAAELKKDVIAGKPLADIASTLGIAVETKSGIRRNATDTILGPGAIATVFSGPVGTVGNEATADGEDQILLKVTEVNEQPTTNVLDNPAQDVSVVASAAGDDILDQMVNALQTNYGVTINRTLADQSVAR